MAVSGTYYLNAPSLASATSVFDDALLTTLSADGYYAEGVIVRQQVGGILLPQQLCPTYIGFSASVLAASSAAACLLSETETYYSLSGFVNLGDTIFVDSCGLTLLDEGFYRADAATSGGDSWFEVDGSGIVVNKGDCFPSESWSVRTESGSVPAGICSETPFTVYSATGTSFVSGTALFSDPALTTSLFITASPNAYISEVLSGTVFEYNNGLGEVGTNTGSTC